MTDTNYDTLEQLEAWARERGHTLGELAHAWLLAQPPVSSVISGATTLEQVQTNAMAAGWNLTPEERVEVNALLT
jgi:aryl-alcohol dehydrogenase-like predicted oxidoreductase